MSHTYEVDYYGMVCRGISRISLTVVSTVRIVLGNGLNMVCGSPSYYH